MGHVVGLRATCAPWDMFKGLHRTCSKDSMGHENTMGHNVALHGT